ncbi:hypothetical protein EA472_04905 [Natrarchaeobius oligotrophus]|uniref:Uncharacterized protein n=1 Tax=Natrarchaeobius chitinivorans TaxID=1679083 RepID=A0A3N6MHL4_NATCH|nr:hypothetical protein EA472_04905 [Natrarchaeobius chitinivorans]
MRRGTKGSIPVERSAAVGELTDPASALRSTVANSTERQAVNRRDSNSAASRENGGGCAV